MQQTIAASCHVTLKEYHIISKFAMSVATHPCGVKAKWFCSPAPPSGEQRAFNSLSTPQITAPR